MQLSRVFFLLALVLAPVALLSTTWLYLYPLFDKACAFPTPANTTSPAPFRLLALGDPQLEGDSSLPKAGAKIFRSFNNLGDNLADASTLLDKFQLVQTAIRGIPRDVLRALGGYVRKPIDIWGNDYYLAHIVRTLRWWTEPSHVAVLGDLLGSQWVKDDEFERRSKRYWEVVFRGMERVPERVMSGGKELERREEEGIGSLEDDLKDQGEETEDDDEVIKAEDEPEAEAEEEKRKWGGTVEILGEDPAWANRVINIAGNHDIGYAGDIDTNRIARFERAFGAVNWDIVFKLPNTTIPGLVGQEDTQQDVPALRIVVLNTMNLDTPALDSNLQRETYDFINHIITTSRSVTDKTHATVLLTHIPLYKEPGICVDSPFFDFFEQSGVKEQNMLSDYASKIVLESMFGLSSNKWADGQGFGRRGIIINGHDHAGCDVLHYTTQSGVDGGCPENIDAHDIHLPPALPPVSASLSPDEPLEDSITANDTVAETPKRDADPEPEDPKWAAQRFPHRPYKASPAGECIAFAAVPRIREVTLRSMMGEFSGYAGFLSAWFDASLGEKGEWRLELSTCGLGVQHWWWAVHIVDLLLVVALGVGGVIRVVESLGGREDVKGKTKINKGKSDGDGDAGQVVGEKKEKGSEVGRRAVGNGQAVGKIP